MGLSGYSAKPSHCWVNQATHPSQLTVGLIRLSIQGSHMVKCTSRHSQANTLLGLKRSSYKPKSNWVYQATHPIQYTIGFHRHSSNPISFGFYRMLRQWKGRMTTLVSSNLLSCIYIKIARISTFLQCLDLWDIVHNSIEIDLALDSKQSILE